MKLPYFVNCLFITCLLLFLLPCLLLGLVAVVLVTFLLTPMPTTYIRKDFMFLPTFVCA